MARERGTAKREACDEGAQRSRNFKRDGRCRIRILTETEKQTHTIAHSVAALKDWTAPAGHHMLLWIPYEVQTVNFIAMLTAHAWLHR